MLCDPGSESRLGGGREKKQGAKMTTKWDGEKQRTKKTGTKMGGTHGGENERLFLEISRRDLP